MRFFLKKIFKKHRKEEYIHIFFLGGGLLYRHYHLDTGDVGHGEKHFFFSPFL
jgi:hypothetical protein